MHAVCCHLCFRITGTIGTIRHSADSTHHHHVVPDSDARRQYQRPKSNMRKAYPSIDVRPAYMASVTQRNQFQHYISVARMHGLLTWLV